MARGRTPRTPLRPGQNRPQPGSNASAIERAARLHQHGLLAEAEPVYREILARTPEHFDALHLLGVLEHQKGRHESAVELIERAIRLNAGRAAPHSNIGLALHALGRREEALAAFERALTLRPDYAEAFNHRGRALRDLGRREEALASFERALALKPGYAEALTSRGGILQELERPEEALASYDRALALRPDDPETLNQRGAVLLDLGRPEEALASCERALALAPDSATALNNRANILRELGRAQEALASCDRALALEPGYATAHNNRGNILRDLNRPREALESYGRALELNPAYANAHVSESLCRLSIGDFEKGWRRYEWRWQDAQRGSQRGFTQPLWEGQAIAGKTILLHAEQGLGDTLQFCRYAGLMAERGATVLLEVQPPLAPLLGGLEGVHHLLARGEPPPAFDYHCPLLSLPLAVGTTLQTIPADRIPYLRSDPQRVAEWRTRLDARTLPRVGIAWAGSRTHGNDRNRSLPLAALLPWLARPVQLVSLQKDLRPADRATLDAHPGIVHHGEALQDFADTAALVDLVDLVVTVDTALAHLAGAMGKPVWILLPYAPDWRWLLDREDSPWYPSARLFRQSAAGAWADVIERVGNELERLKPG